MAILVIDTTPDLLDIKLDADWPQNPVDTNKFILLREHEGNRTSIIQNG